MYLAERDMEMRYMFLTATKKSFRSSNVLLKLLFN